jgi:aminopeptidase-like protein
MNDTPKQIIENLYPINRCLLGEGYDKALEYLNNFLPMEVLEFKSGTEVGTWTVPDEWIVRDAYVEFKGEKIIDYKKEPLSLVVGSLPFSGFMDKKMLLKHLCFSEEMPDSTPYVFKYYDKDWGFCVKKSEVVEENTSEESSGVTLNGEEFKFKTKDKLEEGMYRVHIDTEYKPGIMKVGVHTIPGKSDREILLFAHLDHPYQANDNLSAVAALVDFAGRVSSEHTIKIVFCPETIGSTAYALTQDLSKVEFMVAVDICGNKNSFLLQKSFNGDARINKAAHLALQHNGETYRKGQFRNTIGSDENAFNDPLIGIPGIMLSTWPYNEYHTSDDTPDRIDYDTIEKTVKVLLKTIEVYEKDYIPVRNFKGQLMRSKYGIQTGDPQVNLSWDYLIYSIDGKKTLVELVSDYGLNFEFVHEIFEKMIEHGDISKTEIGSSDSGKKPVKKTTRKK